MLLFIFCLKKSTKWFLKFVKEHKTLSSQGILKNEDVFGEFALPGPRLGNKATFQLKTAVRTSVY